MVSLRAQARPSPNDEQIGPYRIIGPIAEGGMGVVYHARHADSGERVALKVVRVSDEGLLASFRREVFALRSLQHPAVIRIVDDGVTHGQLWYAMPLLEGPTLGDYIDEIHALRSEPPPDSRASRWPAETDPKGQTGVFALRPVPELERTLSIMHALCEPLAYLHGEGLVHRDLKPDNIVLDDDTPIVVDFGLALRFGGGEAGRDVLDVAGRALGTPPYMAPEQIRGELVDARADLYALGCMLYECLTGEPPFTGSAVAVLDKHLDSAPRPPSQIVAGVPAPVDRLVLRLLEKRARDRLGYAADVAEALRESGARAPFRAWPLARPYLYLPQLAGRSAVLRDLEQHFAPRRHMRGSFMLIGGESGVGKTRLATELATIASRRGYAVVTGSCLDVAASGSRVHAGALHPLRPLLSAIADRCVTGGPSETERLLGEHAAVLARYEPALEALVGGHELADLPADAARDRLFASLSAAARAYAERQPLFLVLDDLQWADELSLAFLLHLDADFFRETDIIVVGTYRIEERTTALSSLLEADHVRSVALGPLSMDAVTAMVGDMLALSHPPAALIEFLMAASEGNPFFIAEYLRLAIGSAVLRRDISGVWALGATDSDSDALRAALGVPGGLREVVARRCALLDPASRALGELAAVFGRSLDGDVLLRAAERLDGVSPRAALETLRVRQILEEAERGALRFVHDKLREQLYDELGVERRAKLHLIAAETIEAEQRARPDPASSAILAHHYDMAERREEALHHLERAGERALAAAASDDAKGFFARAIALGDRGGGVHALRRAKWQRGLGEACYNLGDVGNAREHLGAALASLGVRPRLARGRAASAISSLAAVGGQLRRLVGRAVPVCRDAVERQRLRHGALAAERLSQVHFFLNEQAQSFAAALEALQLAERLGPSAELARACATMGVAANYARAPGIAQRYGRRAQAIAEDVGDAHATGYVLLLRGLHAIDVGKHADARGYLEYAGRVAQQNRDVRMGQEILTNLGQAYNMAGERRRALRCYADLDRSAHRSRNVQALAWAKSGRATTLTWMGRLDEAIALFEEVRPLTVQSGDVTELLSEGTLAAAYLGAGRWSDALKIADEVCALADGEPAGWHCTLGYVAACETYLAVLEAERGPGRARSEVRQRAQRMVRALKRASGVFRLCAPQAELCLGMLHWLEGRPTRARRAWQRALHIAGALAMPLEAARAHRELGRHADGADARRRHHLERAAALFERVEATHWLARTRNELGTA